MELSKPSWSRRAFYLILLPELVWLAVLLANSPQGGPYGATYVYFFMLWATLALGLANALVASRGKPRWKVAVATSALHGVAIAWQVLAHAPELERSAERDAEYEERARDEQNRERWAAELTPLIVAKRYAEARKYLDAHSMLTAGNDEVFRAALCPGDGSVPDFPLLVALGERGAPSGPDRSVEAAKCSLPAFRAVMQLSSLPANATASDGRTALMTATTPELLAFLLEQGLDVNARDNQGRTALTYHRSADITRMLLAHGADAKAVDQQSRSVLHFGGPDAELGGIFELLLDAGADPNHETEADKFTSLQAMACVERRWSQEAADALVAHGARQLDRLKAIRCIMGHHPIGPALKWPGLDLEGAGGAGLLIRAVDSDPTAVPALLEAGVDPLARDDDGESGLDRYRSRKGEPNPEHPLAYLLLQAAERSSQRDAGI